MSPRPYRLGLRQTSVDETRARMLAAARELLVAPMGISAFTMEAVARQAGVARMTVYYHFESRGGLLDALCDSLALRGGMSRLAGAFQQEDPLVGLSMFIGTFADFWASDRLLLRRLNALAALDPELADTLSGRFAGRRQGLRVLLGRLAHDHGRPRPEAFDEAVEILYVLTSFETFDAVAGPEGEAAKVAAVLNRVALAAMDLRVGS